MEKSLVKQEVRTVMPSSLKGSTVTLLNSEYAIALTHENILAHSPQVSLVKKEQGREVVLAFLTKAINELGRCVLNDWSVDDKIYFAESLMNEYWYLRMDDFISAFRKGINQYEKETGRMQYKSICDWINAYWAERMEYLEGKHLQTKGSSQATLDNKHFVYKDRGGKTSDARRVAPDENYFKNIYEQSGKRK